MNIFNDKIPAIPPTKELRCFLAVAEFGRLNLAAKALNLTESAISHQVTRLENRLGVMLFQRDNKGARLSRDGVRFLAKVREGYRLLYKAVDEIKSNNNFKVTITLPRALVVRWFSPLLIEIKALLPEIELQVLATERVCDFAKEDIDLGVRYISMPEQIEGYHHRFIAREMLFPICSVKTKAKIDSLGWENCLNEIVLVKNKVQKNEWDYWTESFPVKLPTKSIELDDYDLCFQACYSSNGVMMGRKPMPDKLDYPQMVAVFSEKKLYGREIYLIWRKDINYPKSTIELIELIASRLSSFV